MIDDRKTSGVVVAEEGDNEENFIHHQVGIRIF